MYSPDRSIVRKLKEYDPNLNARWDNLKERWIVTYRGKDVIIVINDDGSYRPLDERVLLQVAFGDSHRYERASDIARLVNQSNREVRRANRKAMSDYFQAVAKDDVYRTVFGGPMVPGWRAS